MWPDPNPAPMDAPSGIDEPVTGGRDQAVTLRFRAIWVIAGEFLNKHFGMTLTGQSRTLSPGCRGGMVVIPYIMRGHDEGHRVPEFRTPDA